MANPFDWDKGTPARLPRQLLAGFGVPGASPRAFSTRLTGKIAQDAPDQARALFEQAGQPEQLLLGGSLGVLGHLDPGEVVAPHQVSGPQVLHVAQGRPRARAGASNEQYELIFGALGG